MSKNSEQNDLRPEYGREDLGKGVGGKYHDAYHAAHNLVLLEPEVAEAFPDEEAVNEALKSLLRIARRSAAGDEDSTPSEG